MTRLFDPNAHCRSEAEWRQLLGQLIVSLSEFTGVRFETTSWFVQNDQPDYASACNCVDIRGVVSASLQLDICGVICVTINFGEAVWISSNLMLFSGGSRLSSSEGRELLVLSYTEAGWSVPQWVVDELGEWQSHTTDARWGGA